MLVAWGALAFGAVYPWAYWPLAAGCALLGMYGLHLGRRTGTWPKALVGGLIAIGAGISVQLIPVARPWLLTVGRATDTFLSQFDLSYAFNPPEWHPLSIAPSSTLRGAVLFGALALFLLGLIRLLPYLRLDSLARGLMVFGVLFALFGIVQEAFLGEGPRHIYGFWQPREGANPFGSFVNRNHYAGWMLMALPVVLGYSCGLLERSRPRGEGWRGWVLWTARPESGAFILAALSVLVMGTALVVTGSRSGIVSFALATLVTAGFVLRRVSSPSTRTVVALGLGVLLLSAIAWGGINATADRFSTASADIEGRFMAWRDTIRIAHDFPVHGTGLNTYGTAMLIYQSGDRQLFYREAHNDYLQLIAEGGVLLGVPIVLTIGIFARGVWRRFHSRRDDRMRYWIRAGAVAGLAGVAAQSFLDFSLQMPGNAALFVLLAAIAVHEPYRTR